MTWGIDTPGVIEFPDGTRVRGRGLSKTMPAGELPEFGLYLLGEQPPAVEWESSWVRWPDFRVPSDPAVAAAALVDAHRRAQSARVELACRGGRGRTGTALACLAVIGGVSPDDAVAYVRRKYHPKAVETPFQRRFVARFARLL